MNRNDKHKKQPEQLLVCEKDMCCGCRLCQTICPKGAISIVDSLRALNSIIDLDKCISCRTCYRICPQNNPPLKIPPIQWYQGWANETIRKKSSSGGFARPYQQRLFRPEESFSPVN